MSNWSASGAITEWLIFLAAALAFAISAAQSFIVESIGSDHPVHVFLTRRIRKNRYRLFVRIPDLLNDCYCGAVPLYLHWIIAHFGKRAVYWCERLLNPAVNAVHVILASLIGLYVCRHEGLPGEFAALAAALFALTPQFYHALSARNFGLSARGTGLALLTAFFAVAYLAQQPGAPLESRLALGVLGWLIWGFSTFAQQALCILSVLMLLFTGRWTALGGAASGLALFVALHPRYSLGYLRHTAAFIRTYAKELAPIYILKRRESVWRDLVWDIWVRFGKGGTAQALRYAYENPVVTIVILNPFAAWCCWEAVRGGDFRHGIFGYCLALTLCGSAAALLTSFRVTRFLGEPERYVEAVSCWAVLYGAHEIFERVGLSGLIWSAAAFLLLDILQLTGSRILTKSAGDRTASLEQIEQQIEARWGAAARVCANHEHYTKMMMQHDWQYAYCLAVGAPYCGMTVTEAFSAFPILRKEACERIAEAFRINACLLDRTQYEVIFDQRPPGLRSLTVAYESDRFRLLFLEWD